MDEEDWETDVVDDVVLRAMRCISPCGASSISNCSETDTPVCVVSLRMCWAVAVGVGVT